MITIVGLSVIGGAVLIFTAIGLISSRRRIRKEMEAKKRSAAGGPDGQTLCTWRHETGAGWRQRPG